MAGAGGAGGGGGGVRFYRRRGFRIGVGIVVVLLVVLGLVSACNGVRAIVSGGKVPRPAASSSGPAVKGTIGARPATTRASPAASSSPTPVASTTPQATQPAVAGGTATCTAMQPLTGGLRGVTTRTPAALQVLSPGDFDAYVAAGANLVVDFGTTSSPGEANAYSALACSKHMAAAVEVDDQFAEPGFIKALDHTNLAAVVLSINKVPSANGGDPNQMRADLNARIATLRSETNLPVWAWVNWSGMGASWYEAINADRLLIADYTFDANRLAQVGALAATVNSSAPTAAVALTSVAGTEISADPTPGQVAHMVAALWRGGARNFVGYTEEPGADKLVPVARRLALMHGGS